MLGIAIAGSLVAASMNAASSVLQRIAAGKPASHLLYKRQFIRKVITHNYYLIGVSLQVIAFFIQAYALNNGPLSLVETLMTMDLVFLLVFIRIRTGVRIGFKEWAIVGVIAASLATLIAVAQPHGGRLKYTAEPWVVTCLVMFSVIVGIIYAVRRIDDPRLRGALASLAAAMTFALNAAFTKLTLNILHYQGIVRVLEYWPIYALIGSGISSMFLLQSAYAAGPLAITQPIMEIAEPTISVILGITIFGDVINHSTGALAVELILAVILVVGLIMLSRSKKVQSFSSQGL